MLIDQLRWEFSQRFVLKQDYLLALKFDPNQQRDAKGRWTESGGGVPAVIVDSDPIGLAAEARKAGSFENFSHDFSINIKHGLYWHLTDNPNFAIDVAKGPRDMSSMAEGAMEAGALMVTSDLETWEDYYNTDPNTRERVNKRQYAVLVDLSGVPRQQYKQISRGFGNEFFIPDSSKAKVLGVVPIKTALTLDAKHHAALPQSDEELRTFYDRAVAKKWEEAKHPRDSTGKFTEAGLQAVSERIIKESKGRLAVLDLRSKATGNVEIETLAVAPGEGNKGVGTRAMESLTEWADDEGVQLILSPSQKGYQPVEKGPKTTSLARLKAFYKLFGFVEPKGRHYDPTLSSPTRPVMFRPPKVKKYDPQQPRGEKGTAQGGRWVKGTAGKEHWVGEGEPTEPVVGRKFTSEEGYQWHEKGPGRVWAMGMDPKDHAALDSYVAFGYRQVNELRRGIQPTRERKIRGLTPEEHKALLAAGESGADHPVPPEGPEFRYLWAYEHARDVPSGPDKLAAHWAVVGPKVDQERLADVSKQADQLDEMIAKRGLVLEEDIVVERGAYLPGVSVQDLKTLETYPDDHPWEEKAFTSTFLGDAEGRARSYPALGKWESIHQRHGGKIADFQDEVGTAVRFYITLPKGTKVASAEAARRVDMVYPRIQDPSVFEHPEWTADGKLKPEDFTIEDRTQKPTVRTRDLESKDQRSESEILLGSGARFRVTKVKKGYTYESGDPTLKPVEVYEVHMEYIGGGSSEGRH